MSKIKNQRIWSDDPEFLKNIAAEQDDYIGRPYKLDLKAGVITIFALPPKRRTKKQKDKAERDKQTERRSRER